MNKLKKVGVGCIGCGFVANEIHLPNYLSSPKADIIAVADINKELAKETADRYNIKKIFSDYTDLLKNDDIDAISICVPTHLHSKITIEAAEAGKHILCEKPIAISIKESEKMIQAAENNNVKLMIGHPLRFLPNHQLARKMISENKIGKVYFSRAQSTSPGPYGTSGIKSPFYFDPNKGGGALFDMGYHLVDMLIWFFGDISEAKGTIGTYRPDINQADDIASLSLKFNDGLLGQIFVSWVNIQNWNVMTTFNNLQVVGEEGIIESNLWGPYLHYFNDKSLVCKIKGKIKMTPANLDANIPFIAKNYAYKQEIESFINSILKDISPPITGEDGLKALKGVLKAIQN